MSRHGAKGVYLYSGQEIEDFVTAHGGKWPIRGYAYVRETLYHRKKDGGITRRYVSTLFISSNSRKKTQSVSDDSIPDDDEHFRSEYTSDLSAYSSEELGYF